MSQVIINIIIKQNNKQNKNFCLLFKWLQEKTVGLYCVLWSYYIGLTWKSGSVSICNLKVHIFRPDSRALGFRAIIFFCARELEAWDAKCWDDKVRRLSSLPLSLPTCCSAQIAFSSIALHMRPELCLHYLADTLHHWLLVKEVKRGVIWHQNLSLFQMPLELEGHCPGL